MTANVTVSQILLKRGNTLQSGSYVGPIGEIVIDTDIKTLRIQDGVTEGGHIILANNDEVTAANLVIASLANSISTINTEIALINSNISNAQTDNYGDSNVAAYLPTDLTIQGITSAWQANTSILYTDIQNLINNNVSLSDQLVNTNAAIATANSYNQSYTTTALSTAINNLINSAPGTLDTLGQIAANLANEGSAITAITNSITNINSSVTAANAAIVTANTAIKNYVDDSIFNVQYSINYVNNNVIPATISQLDTAILSNVNAANTAISTLNSLVNQNVTTTGNPTFNSLVLGGTLTGSGNVHLLSNLQVDGNINFLGNVIQNTIFTSNGVFTGDTHGFGALYAGTSVYTPLPYTVIQATANYADYSQINFQNFNTGSIASADWVATAGNGNDTNNYIDMGIASGTWDGTQTNSVGTAALANDGYLYTQGNTTQGTGGNLVIGTIAPNKKVKILTGGPGASNIVSYFDINGLTTSNITAAQYFFANGQPFVSSNYSNVNVAAYLISNPQTGTYSNSNVTSYLLGNITAGNLNIGHVQIHTLDNSITTDNGSAVQFSQRVNFNSTNGIYSNGLINAQAGLSVSGNSNATSFYGSSYNYANGVSILAGISGTYNDSNVASYLLLNPQVGTYSNSNVASYLLSNPQTGTYSNTNVSAYIAGNLTTINANITAANSAIATLQTLSGTYATATQLATVQNNYNTLSANVGAFETYSNATFATTSSLSIYATATQLTTVQNNYNTLSANVGAFETWANATFSTGVGSTYSNANVASYLPTYSGNIGAANIVTTGATSGNISGANYISANVFQVSNGIFWANGTAWSSSGGSTYTSSGAGNITVAGSTLALTTTGPGATTIGGASSIPVVTTDAYGRITALTSAAVVAPAGTLSGSTLNSTVTTSSLTTVGTLGSLTVSGNITAGNVIANQYGNSIGTTAAYTGNITAANIITTGTYGNITGANVISANTVTVTTTIRTVPVTVATLPNASSVGAGARAFVTDANSTTFNASAVGGGSNSVPVFSNGTNWYIG